VKPQFFILGSPRSGTSLFRIILTCHADILIPPECGFIQWLYESYHGAKWEQPETLYNFASDVSKTRKFSTWNVPREVLVSTLEHLAPTEYSSAVQGVFKAYGSVMGKKPEVQYGDKNNYYTQHIPLLLDIFPDAKFIHLVRDGRDVACSYRALKGLKPSSPFVPHLPYEIMDIAKEWVFNVEMIRDGLSLCAEDKVLEVRYCDLLQNTSSVLEEVTTFLGLRFDEAMLGYYDQNRRLGLEPEEMLSWKTKTLEPLDGSRVGRYLTELSKGQIEEFEATALPILRDYKYVT